MEKQQIVSLSIESFDAFTDEYNKRRSRKSPLIRKAIGGRYTVIILTSDGISLCLTNKKILEEIMLMLIAFKKHLVIKELPDVIKNSDFFKN